MSPGRQPGRHGKASGPLPGPPRPRVYSTASTRGRRQSRTMAMGTLGHCWCLVQCQGHRGCWLGAVSEGAHCKGTGCPCALGPVPTATGPSCVSRCSMGRGVWCTHTCTRPCTHTRVHAHPHAQRCPHMCTPVNAFSGHGCAHRHEKAPACTLNPSHLCTYRYAHACLSTARHTCTGLHLHVLPIRTHPTCNAATHVHEMSVQQRAQTHMCCFPEHACTLHALHTHTHIAPPKHMYVVCSADTHVHGHPI